MLFISKIKRIINRLKQKYKMFCFNQYNKSIASCFKNCGDGLKVFGRLCIYSGNKITIGENCKINEGVYLNGRSGITIGDDVTLSPFCKIISTGYDIEQWVNNGQRVHFENKPITIASHCWIGAGAIVLPGVSITGEYVVIGAGAVVTSSITNSRVLVAGNPARIVKEYDVLNS